MPDFLVTCRAVFDQGVVAKLDTAGIYWTQGGATHPNSSRHRHHLRVGAKSGEEAVLRAREAVEAAGGEADDLTLIGEASD
jgi:hypothetical protein